MAYIYSQKPLKAKLRLVGGVFLLDFITSQKRGRFVGDRSRGSWGVSFYLIFSVYLFWKENGFTSQKRGRFVLDQSRGSWGGGGLLDVRVYPFWKEKGPGIPFFGYSTRGVLLLL